MVGLVITLQTAQPEGLAVVAPEAIRIHLLDLRALLGRDLPVAVAGMQVRQIALQAEAGVRVLSEVRARQTPVRTLEVPVGLD